MSADRKDNHATRRQRMGKDPLASLGFGVKQDEVSDEPESQEGISPADTEAADHDQPEGSGNDATGAKTPEKETPPTYRKTPLATAQSAHQELDKPAKKRVSFVLPLDLVEQARDAAHWVPGVTITALVEQGLYKEIERLQAEHNSSQRFPKREAPLKRGRPVSH